ncbi:MAG: sigma-70 family RNA polymerase sigma factor [Planctomycetota bacterium]
MDIDQAITAIKAGDVERFETIVRTYQKRVRAFVAVFMPDENQVDDIAQEAFVRAFEMIGEYRANTNFYAWLKAIARNTLLAALKTKKRELAKREQYLEAMQKENSIYELEEGNTNDDAVIQLKKCVEQLSESNQRMIRKRYTENRPLDSLSAELNRSVDSIKVSLFRIRKALKDCLESAQTAV